MDYISPCLLFVAALACGNSAVVEMQTGWKEKALLYLAIVGGRGTNKTSCFDFALAPIRKKDDSEYERYVEAKTLYDAEFLKPLKDRNQKLEQRFLCLPLGTFGIIGTFGILNRFKVPEVPKMPERDRENTAMDGG